MRNTGKPSETAFEKRMRLRGKRAFVYRFPDAAEVRGRTGAIGFTRKAPADYLVTEDGETYLAEVKSTDHAVSFPFSLIKSGQTAAARQTVAAGGRFDVFVHQTDTDRWFRIPFTNIDLAREAGRESMKWTDMEGFAWV